MVFSCPKCNKEIKEVDANYCSHCGSFIPVQPMTQQERDELDCRKVLLDSYNSHLGVHGSLIIGFAVILLTLLEIRGRYLQSDSMLQLSLLYVAVFSASWAWCYLFCRHLVYGLLVTYAIVAEPSGTGNTLTRMSRGIYDEVLRKPILFFPSCLFLPTERRGSKYQIRRGYGICTILAGLVTLCAWLLLG